MPNSVQRVAIRPATRHDIGVMLALDRECPAAAHWREADYARIFDVEAMSRAALIAETDSQVAGFIVFATVGSDWEIENIVVSPNSRRLGVATALIREALSRAAEKGAERFFLEVRQSNAGARAFYERIGFVEVGRRKGYYSNPAEDALIYERVLSAS